MAEAQVSHVEVDPDDEGMRLDRWLRRSFPEVPLGALSKIVRTGQLRVDGARAKLDTRLAAGQSVRLPPQMTMPAPAGSLGGEAAALEAMVIHRDDHVVVLNKPYGLAVQGGSGLSRHIDGMLEAWRDRKGRKPRLVHRLDRDTTGLLVVALTRSAAAALAESFKGRDAHKTYWALVRGHPVPEEGRISTWLGRDPNDGEKMAVLPQKTKEAVRATSLYETLDRSGQLSLLRLSPVTGRTHQLRVHCMHMGVPIIGDPKYFNIENWALPGGIQNRLHLHARHIELPHPAGGTLSVTAPVSPHFRQSLTVLGLSPEGG
ncbi:RluA family pseudouridine synthase [Acuticoccus sp. I52.16.1]|uniref:RluA family pseudouridine synthase n=1 Tax=Acuticoccus sp. I52.16.1 TaxID=2928472 RepID=UPI001FD12682|nr:RluA family pseudouridine synthase [Acuticoccus sp. I52.16.1]UOM35423.1 RluA family pseudouridine synthase [Acuticoccus sp. I52.16.1]